MIKRLTTFKQYAFPALIDGNGEGINEIGLRAKTEEHRKAVERRYSQALGYAMENPGAKTYQIAKFVRQTVWPEAKQGTAEAAVKRWSKSPHWKSHIPT